jgi:hypothetical protein
MTNIKICPDCTTEYFAHIENCADCGSVLLSPEEHERVQEDRKRCKEKILEDTVVLKDGDLKWIDELYNVLINAGIPCAVNADTGCKKGCCGNPYQLLVSREHAEKANELVEEHYTKLHPEIQVSREMMSQGNCPACSSPVDPNAAECPDCGLVLIINEQ